VFHQLLGQVFLVLMLLICGWALWRGEKPERLAAAAMVAAWIGTSFVLDRRFKDIQWATLGVDFALLVVLIGLSLTYRRRWLLGAAGFHLLGVATHGAMIIDPRVQATPYIVALGVWSVATMACLGVGMTTLTRSRAAVR
jgi:hypothetical protein